MAPKNSKRPRFYVGSTNVRDGWAKHTLNEAIADAKALVESTGHEQYVVQVIRVVRKRPTPIIVETVRG